MRLAILTILIIGSLPGAALTHPDHLRALTQDELLHRAIHLQHHHEFDAALADLAVILDADPDHAQARLTRAFIHQALGEPLAGLADCDALPAALPSLVFAACRSRMLSLSGEAEVAQTLLALEIERSRNRAPDRMMVWTLRIQADTARRLGQPKEADKLLRQAVTLDPESVAANTALADVLLLQGEADAVLDLPMPDHPAAKVRVALAARDLGQPFRIGDSAETRDAALRALEFGDDVSQALALAEENWLTHREPEDARLLLRAALAAGSPQRADEVIAWVRERELEDVEFEALLPQ